MLARFFIDRPVLACVLSVVILLLGWIRLVTVKMLACVKMPPLSVPASDFSLTSWPVSRQPGQLMASVRNLPRAFAYEEKASRNEFAAL